MKIIFVISTTMLGGFIGIFYGIASVPKNSGLAGPAEVLWYGVVVAVISLVLSIIISNRLNPVVRKRIAIIFLLICLIPVCWFIYRVKTIKPVQEQTPSTPQQTTQIDGFQSKDQVNALLIS